MNGLPLPSDLSSANRPSVVSCRGALTSITSRIVIAGALFLAVTGTLSRAQAPAGPDTFIARYQARVTATQNEQPHWVTPLVTVTPRLEQEIRSDFVRQTNTKLLNTWNYGNSKGLEIIPTRRIELLFNAPPFFAHDAAAHTPDGFGDVSFNSKFRFFARNEEHGNAIITGFVAGTYPTGKHTNGSCCATATPTLAVGKGFGLLALISTAGGSLPASNGKQRQEAWPHRHLE